MIKMENRKKVILHPRNGWDEDYKLALTKEQIDLLGWLLDEGLLSVDDYDLQVLEDVDKWREI